MHLLVSYVIILAEHSVIQRNYFLVTRIVSILRKLSPALQGCPSFYLFRPHKSSHKNNIGFTM